MRFEPCNSWVMIRVEDESGTVRKSGLIIPNGADGSQFMTGIVRAVGPGLWSVDQIKRIPVSLEVGDKVLFVNGGLEHKVDGIKYVLTQETNIVGVLRDVGVSGSSELDSQETAQG